MSKEWENEDEFDFSEAHFGDQPQEGNQQVQQIFDETYGRLDYWRDRPMRELDIKIRTLENENFPQSSQNAQRLRDIKDQLYNVPTITPSTRQTVQRSAGPLPVNRFQVTARPHDWRRIGTPRITVPQRSTSTPGTTQGTSKKTILGRGEQLPPDEISGRITGGSVGKFPNIESFHPYYPQMKKRHQRLATDRHERARQEFEGMSRNTQRISDPEVDEHIDELREMDSGLRREPFDPKKHETQRYDTKAMTQRMGQTLASSFRSSRKQMDEKRELNSNTIRDSALAYGEQRRKDMAEMAEDRQWRTQGRRRSRAKSQQPDPYVQEWKASARGSMEFGMIPDWYGDKPTDKPITGPYIPEDSKLKKFMTKLKKPFKKFTKGNRGTETRSDANMYETVESWDPTVSWSEAVKAAEAGQIYTPPSHLREEPFLGEGSGLQRDRSLSQSAPDLSDDQSADTPWVLVEHKYPYDPFDDPSIDSSLKQRANKWTRGLHRELKDKKVPRTDVDEYRHSQGLANRYLENSRNRYDFEPRDQRRKRREEERRPFKRDEEVKHLDFSESAEEPVEFTKVLADNLRKRRQEGKVECICTDCYGRLERKPGCLCLECHKPLENQ